MIRCRPLEHRSADQPGGRNTINQWPPATAKGEEIKEGRDRHARPLCVRTTGVPRDRQQEYRWIRGWRPENVVGVKSCIKPLSDIDDKYLLRYEML